MQPQRTQMKRSIPWIPTVQPPHITVDVHCISSQGSSLEVHFSLQEQPRCHTKVVIMISDDSRTDNAPLPEQANPAARESKYTSNDSQTMSASYFSSADIGSVLTKAMVSYAGLLVLRCDHYIDISHLARAAMVGRGTFPIAAPGSSDPPGVRPRW